jgi:hypothetical protein
VSDDGEVVLPIVTTALTPILHLRAMHRALGEHLEKVDASREAKLITWTPKGEPN